MSINDTMIAIADHAHKLTYSLQVYEAGIGRPCVTKQRRASMAMETHAHRLLRRDGRKYQNVPACVASTRRTATAVVIHAHSLTHSL